MKKKDIRRLFISKRDFHKKIKSFLAAFRATRFNGQ
jgi:hypothetical protein